MVTGRDVEDQFQVHETASRWIRLSWCISPKTRQRAAAAMGGSFHRALLVLRAAKLSTSEAGPPSTEPVTETNLADDSQEWFLRLPDGHPLWSFELGYRGGGRFHSLARTSLSLSAASRQDSQTGTAPLATINLQEVLRDDGSAPPLELHGELAVRGRTAPFAQVTIDDRSVPVDSQSGEFCLRFPARSGRNVYAVVASAHGRHRRALLAVEINVHLLEEEPPEEP